MISRLRAYPKVLEDSWIVLRKPDYVELYRAVEVDIDARTDFNLTSKTTRIKLDTQEHLSWFGLRETVVFAQSEQLDLAKYPLSGVTSAHPAGRPYSSLVPNRPACWAATMEQSGSRRRVPPSIPQHREAGQACVQQGLACA